MAEWVKRELIGEHELDRLSEDKKVVLKGFRKWWEDGSSCLDIMKYVRTSDSETLYYPIQHVRYLGRLQTHLFRCLKKERVE